MIDIQMQEIAKRREFTCFWEAIDYMLLANYSECEAIMIGLELFNGQIWDKVINAVSKQPNINEVYVYSGRSNFFSSSGMSTTVDWIGGIDPVNIESDDLLVEIYIMTKEANPIYMPLYKSYIETRKYAEISMLEGHIKLVTCKLTTELAINLFKNGCKQINK